MYPSQAQGIAGVGSDQQQLQILNHKQALMQQAMPQQQQGLYHTGLMPLKAFDLGYLDATRWLMEDLFPFLGVVKTLLET